MKKSKTNKEIYEQEYPFEMVSSNPMICSEAIGYLKALNQYFPSEEKWTNTKLTELTLILLFFSLD